MLFKFFDRNTISHTGSFVNINPLQHEIESSRKISSTADGVGPAGEV